MRRYIFLGALLCASLSWAATDPLQTKIYHLKNGLTVYLGVNHDEPRIQTYIAVHAGSKNDPAESTGLAHYLEHLMFKGTEQFGTTDYAAEKPYLNQIDSLYEVYRSTTDTTRRAAIYHEIDSISYQSSRIAIANEYDKLMSGIGARGTNAFTSTDMTVYTENIPSNKIEPWARVQADRFQHLVIRGFHTELEAVYEEYNIGLTQDFRSILRAMSGMLMPTHPYGTQTTIGTQEHLKNPSLLNVKNYYRQYYVPNNVAICMVGDLNPDSTLAILEKYFEDWQPNPNLPQLHFPDQKPLQAEQDTTILGHDADWVVLGWLLPGGNQVDAALKSQVVDRLLSNGVCGLLDLDLNMKQKVMQAQGFLDDNCDYSPYILFGIPKQGQTLTQVKDLLVAEIEKLRKGEFSDQLLQAVKDNLCKEHMESMLDNENAAMAQVECFINGTNWSDAVNYDERVQALTRADILAYVNQWFGQGFACVYKKQGTPDEKKVDKPHINPIEMNRDKVSDFVTEVLRMDSSRVEPYFYQEGRDYQKKGGIYYRQNTQNGLFEERFYFPGGQKENTALNQAAELLNFLGTKRQSAEDIQTQFYSLACEANVHVGDYFTVLTISGLEKNRAAAEQLFWNWLDGAKVDKNAYKQMVMMTMKGRMDEKQNQRSNYSHICEYVQYGPKNSYTDVLSTQQMMQMKPKSLIAMLQQKLHGPISALLSYTPAPMPQQQCLGSLDCQDRYMAVNADSAAVLIVPYEAQNIYLRAISVNGETYTPNPALDARRLMFNEYFGGGMNTVVFQELRESRALAYNAYAYYSRGSWKGDKCVFFEHIISQNDKLADCLQAFDSITENLPLAENAFRLAKEQLLQSLSTARYNREELLYHELGNTFAGKSDDYAKQLYEAVEKLTMQDLIDFHRKYVAGRTYRYAIVGDPKQLDMDALRKLGPVRVLTTEEVFGY